MSDSATREEQYLNAIANGESIELTPITREELFLAKAAGQDVKTPTPITRREIFLSKISGGGGGQPSGENKIAQIAEDKLTEITAQDLEGVTTIRGYSFYTQGLLATVTIPNSVTSIGDSAFEGCNKLLEVVNNSNLPISKGQSSYGRVAYFALEVHEGESKMIKNGEYLFYPYSNKKILVSYVGNNTDIVLPDKFSEERYEIYDYAFLRSNLTSVIIPEGYIEVGDYAFSYSFSLAEVILPDSLTKIGSYAFERCRSLKDVVIPSIVASMGQNVFINCIALETLVFLGNEITSLTGICQNCPSLRSVKLPNSLTSMSSSTFDKCTSLVELTIPAKVQRISSNCLKIGSETNKATITFLGTTPPTIQTSTFDANYLNKIIVPAGCGDTYKTATNWSKFADFIEEAAE